MKTSNVAVIVGSVYAILSAIGIFFNILTIHAIFARGTLKKYHSSLYILYLQPLFTDVVLLSIFMCYCSPMVITQSYLFPYPTSIHFGVFIDSLNNYCWFNNSLSQISLAVNRLFATVLFRPHFFTRNRTLGLAAFQHLLALFIMLTPQFVFPCCKLEFDFTIFSYRDALIPGMANAAWTYWKLPAQISCSAIPSVIYVMILLTSRSIGSRIILQSDALKRRRRQEIRFTIQFASLAALYTCTWLVFFFFPYINFTEENIWLHGISVIPSLINSTTNAVLFLLNDARKICTLCTSSSPGNSG